MLLPLTGNSDGLGYYKKVHTSATILITPETDPERTLKNASLVLVDLGLLRHP